MENGHRHEESIWNLQPTKEHFLSLTATRGSSFFPRMHIVFFEKVLCFALIQTIHLKIKGV